MEYKYKPTDYEVRLMILYTINNLKTSVTYTILDRCIGASADVNYFELQDHIKGLISMGNITELTYDGKIVFSLTDSGIETVEFFKERIPFSVREKLDFSIDDINKNELSTSNISAEYYPISHNEYMVKCVIQENNICLLNLEMYAGQKEKAKKISSYFKSNTSEIYKKITEIIDEIDIK